MIGVDVCLISRIARAIENDRFVARVFTPGEREYCEAKVNRAESYTGIYAAKEAVVKALGAGITEFNFHDVEITHAKNGAPKAVLHGEAEKLAAGFNPHVSISHDGDNATAVCVLEARK